MNPKRLLALYEAGDLKRLHALPTCRVHTLAEHVYGAMCIATELLSAGKQDQGVCLEVMQLLLQHDAPEVWTGDVPAHMKKRNPEIEDALGEEETKWCGELGIRPADSYMDEAREVAQAADRLDLAMTCVRERKYGNRHARNAEVFNRAIAYVEEEAVGLPGLCELVELLRREWASG